MGATHFNGPVVSENGFEGDFTGDVTGNLTGNVAGDVTGNTAGIHSGTLAEATVSTYDAPVAKADGDETLTAAQLINQIVVFTVTTGRSLTTPTGAAITTGFLALMGRAAVAGDVFKLHLITVGTGADDIATLTAGDGAVTFVGKVTVGPDTAAIAAYGTFLFRCVSAGVWVGYRVG